MNTVTDLEASPMERSLAKAWWLFLVTGIAWVLVAFASSVQPGEGRDHRLPLGFFLIAAGINELVASGRRQLEVAPRRLGATFVVVGVMALLEPFQTFGILALLIGWYLLFKGIADIFFSIAERDVLAPLGPPAGVGDHRARHRHLGDRLPGALGVAPHPLGGHRCGHPRRHRDRARLQVPRRPLLMDSTTKDHR